MKNKVVQLNPPSGPGLAVKMTKQVLYATVVESIRNTLDCENRFLGEAVATEDFKEFVGSFSMKRQPFIKDADHGTWKYQFAEGYGTN